MYILDINGQIYTWGQTVTQWLVSLPYSENKNCSIPGGNRWSDAVMTSNSPVI